MTTRQQSTGRWAAKSAHLLVTLLAMVLLVSCESDGSKGSEGLSGSDAATATSEDSVDQQDVAPEQDSVREVLESDDPVSRAADEACRQFRSGLTVADFANWFADGFEGDQTPNDEMFQEIVELAITERCPEVVPDD